jgi:hypothetical protein
MFNEDAGGIAWFQHHDQGGIHGFDAEGIRRSQANHQLVAAAEAQRLPAPPVPRLPLDEIAAQIRLGKLIPCPPPGAGDVRMGVSESAVATLAAADREAAKESREEKRARLRRELEELGADEDAPSAPSPSAGEDLPPAGRLAGVPVGGETTRTTNRGGKTR